MTETDSIEQICELYGRMIYRRALGLLGDPEESPRRAAGRSAARVRASRDVPRRGQNTNLALQHHHARLLKPDPPPPLPRSDRGETFAPSRNIETHRRKRALVRTLDLADEREAAAAIHIYLDGMQREEDAAAMGISVRTIGNLLDRFLSWARRKMEAEDRGVERSSRSSRVAS